MDSIFLGVVFSTKVLDSPSSRIMCPHKIMFDHFVNRPFGPKRLKLVDFSLGVAFI